MNIEHNDMAPDAVVMDRPVRSENAISINGNDASAETKSGNRDAQKQEQKFTGYLPHGFSVLKDGVYYTTAGTDEEPGTPMRICAPLRVTALSRDRSSQNWGRVVEFFDADNVRHEWAIPMELLASDGVAVRSELLRLGLEIVPSVAAKSKLSEYIGMSRPKARARCVQQTGWFDDVFVMPARTIGKTDEVIIYQAESSSTCQYQQSGTVGQWRDGVGRLCTGNSRLILAASAALAGMILRLAGQESAGLHFVGSSSTGKTTAQLVAASVFGSPSYKQTWKATGNALEATCALHNDATLILDEMSEVDPKEIGSIIYMIGNGFGKGRAGRSGEAKQRRTWRLMTISSGEIGLAQHMSEGGKIARAGHEVRMIDIPADAGAGYGLFEDLHEYRGGAELSDAIAKATQDFYGSPAVSFLERLTSELKSFSTLLNGAIGAFVDGNLPDGAAGQAARVCKKFAVIAVAGEYATAAGITGWKQGDAVAAASTCFKSWIDSRGGSDNHEKVSILSKVKAFFESNGESRFSDMNDASRTTLNRVGFRQANVDGEKYFVLPEAYKRDICAGFAMSTVTKILIDAGWLEPGRANKSSQVKSLPGIGQTRCYVFTPKMWEV